MTLPLPTQVDDPLTQQDLDFIARRFPIQRGDVGKEAIGEKAYGKESVPSSALSKGAKELFPQLVTAGNRKINFSKSEVEFTVKGLVTAFKAIAHGLGVEPIYVGVSFIAGEDGGIWSTPLFRNIGTTNFEVRFRNDSERAAGTKFPITWVAIG